MAEDVAALTVPSENDPLGVLTGTARVMREASLVTLDLTAAADLARHWAAAPWPETASDFATMHFSDGTERTANWILLLDALNFCFWSLPGESRWQVEWRGATYNGYYALAASLTRGMEEGRPLWDAGYLETLADGELTAILRPAEGSPPIPLFEDRLANAREVGRVLREKYGGSFARAVEAAGRDAVALVKLLARDFPSFADVAEWDDAYVPFLKRAQICVSDLSVAFGGVGLGALTGLDQLTAFADYKLPRLLRREGVLVYAPELAEIVDTATLIPASSAAEVEIRAATIWGVELLRRALAEEGITQTASAIDYRLWLESQQAAPDERPYHRTRTIYY